MQSLCAKVPKDKGEYYRKILTEAHLLNKDLIIKRNDRFLYIPLQKSTDSFDEMKQNSNHLTTWKILKNEKIELIESDFNRYPERINDYKLLLDLPPALQEQLPTSFDIIGTIALIKLPDPLIAHSKKIGDAILKVHKNLSTVARDMGVKGDFRIRDLEIITGISDTLTIHKEYGVKFMLDIAKVYFSPRLSSERWRITQLISSGEIVLDMFAGIGPFSIMIAKFTNAHEIYSIDLNKYAIEYLIRNIDLNKVSNIFPMEGDAKHRIRKVPEVDRIIMNHPFNAFEYLPLAINHLKNKGIIHYHEMINQNEMPDRLAWIKSMMAKYNAKPIKIIQNNLGSYSPKIDHYCFDLVLEKMI
jgi:tRNA (guanine37-N1)-methyltransferase